MTMRKILVILALLAVIPLAHAGGSKQKPKPTPGTRTREFLDAYGHEVALQQIKRIEKMRLFLSKDLHVALHNARIDQQEFSAEHPGEKPALVALGFNSGEGNKYESYTIGLTNMLVKNRVAVDVTFVPHAAANAQPAPVQWKDRYEWVLEGGTWRLDDIVYNSNGRPSPQERRLKALLRAH